MNRAPSYEADAGDRIVAALAQQKIAARERLAPAARLAGQQLEWIMPVVFGSGDNGRLIAGKVTKTFPGATVFVLADEQRVAIIHVLDQPGLVEQIVEIARQLRQYIAANSGNMYDAVVSVISLFLNEYGGDPGAATPPAPAWAASNIIGTLFTGLSDNRIRETLTDAREIAACGFCPAFVALRGPGAKPGTMAGVWPMLLHLAPYMDAALLDAAEAEGRA